MRLGQIVVGGVIVLCVRTTIGFRRKPRESCPQFVHPYDGDDMIYVPIDQSILYGVRKNDDINAVIEVSGDKPHMIITENGKRIFEGDVSLWKFGDLNFTDGKDGDGNESYAPYPGLMFNTDEDVYKYSKLFEGTAVTFTKRAELKMEEELPQ